MVRSRLAAGLVALFLPLLGVAGPAFADHDRGRCYYEDCGGGGDYCAADHDGCGDYGGRDGDGGKQTCFMACYITIPPGMGGGDQAPPERTQSLFPPTPDKIIQGMQAMADAGINLGTTMARLVVDYIVVVFRFIV